MAALLFSTWGEVAHTTVASGYVVALAVICALQYFAHLYRLSQTREEARRFRDEVSDLSDTLNTVQRDRNLTRYENQILREFMCQTECDKAVGLLLRRFIPNTDQGFAAFLQYSDQGLQIAHSRGLSQPSCARLQIDATFQAELKKERSIVLEGAALQRSALWASLFSKDRPKVRQFYLLSVGDGDELFGILLTTDLFPAGAERKQQVELAERLMQSIGLSLKNKQTLDIHKSQLHWTSEMLQLRAVADAKFDSPLLMIEEFIQKLAEKTGADRAALFLSSQDNGVAPKALARAGEPFQTGVRDTWQRHEEILAVAGLAVQEVLQFDTNALARAGVQNLIGRALIVPLVQSDGIIGLICFTKSRRDAFQLAQENLAVWAAEFLAETILRALNHAAVERQARLDGLTQLANRRTFDTRIVQEMTNARNTGAPCALLLFDLDRFKSVNDSYGHLAGDHVLRLASGVLRERVGKIRANDRAVAARYGGEELAVLLPGVGLEGAVRIAESIRLGIEALQIDFEGIKFRVTTSVGIAAFPLHGSSADELIAAADGALYLAKSNGRNRVGLPDASLV